MRKELASLIPFPGAGFALLSPVRRTGEAVCALSAGPAAPPGSRFRHPAGSPDLFPAPEVRRKHLFPRTWQRDRLRGLRMLRRTRRSPPRPAPLLRHLVLPWPLHAQSAHGGEGVLGCLFPLPPARGLSRPVCRGGEKTGLGWRCAAATRLRGVQLQPTHSVEGCPPQRFPRAVI